MKAKIRNTEIYFDVAGMQIAPYKNTMVKKPVLFLIHGGPGGNHINFKHSAMHLQDYAQLVFIDQRGCGLSKKDKKSNYTLENNIEDIEALRKYLGFEKICILGTSYGGMVAQGYAIRYGKNLDGLILVATAPSYKFIESAKANLEKIGTQEQIDFCKKYLWPGKFTSSRQVTHYFNLMDPLYIYDKKKRRKKMDIKIKGFADVKNVLSYVVLNVGFSTFLREFNHVPKLNKIKCPTLILAGKNDWICLPQQAKIMAKEIPNSTLKIFNHCGHSIATDANEKYIKSIKAFLKKL